MSETPGVKALQDAMIKSISDEFTEDEFNELINSGEFIASDEAMTEIRERMAERKAAQPEGKTITWYGKRGQIETVSYPAKTEPEAVPAAADQGEKVPDHE